MSSNYQPEAAIWCALAWVILIARLASRRMRLGAWGSLELEDALAVLAVLLATAMMALLDEYMRNVDALFKFSKTKGLAAKGLKLLFAAEQMQILSIWITKAGMLLLYYRLTGLTDKRKQVIGTAVYVACAFVCALHRSFGSFSPGSGPCRATVLRGLVPTLFRLFQLVG